MRAAACVVLLTAMLALSVPAVSMTAPVSRPAIVRVMEPDEPGLPHRRRRRNHYRGW